MGMAARGSHRYVIGWAWWTNLIARTKLAWNLGRPKVPAAGKVGGLNFRRLIFGSTKWWCRPGPQFMSSIKRFNIAFVLLVPHLIGTTPQNPKKLTNLNCFGASIWRTSYTYLKWEKWGRNP